MRDGEFKEFFLDAFYITFFKKEAVVVLVGRAAQFLRTLKKVHFCTRALELEFPYSRGKNSALGAENKTKKVVDTEENGSDAVFQ